MNRLARLQPQRLPRLGIGKGDAARALQKNERRQRVENLALLC